MHIGHINLSKAFNGSGEHFVELVESLQQHAMQQYVLVRNTALAKRLDIIDGVIVGPVVRSPIIACCLVPDVDIVHIHDQSSTPAGLLLMLTRSVPFVLTRRALAASSASPIKKAACKRASGFVEENQLTASEHLQIYRRAVDSLRVPTMLL